MTQVFDGLADVRTRVDLRTCGWDSEELGMRKRITFLTGTRADFGKLKALMLKLQQSPEFDLYIFVTGMHLNQTYGGTVHEIQKCGFKNIFSFINHGHTFNMDQTLAQTIQGFSNYIQQNPTDLIVVHGDRVEALAGALVGSLNNIRVAHVEGGELSGTIDDSMRHAISKLSHAHFVANSDAARRLHQMGEHPANIWEIGSPDTDIMLSGNLPSLSEAKQRYEIDFENYSILLYHPVTTEVDDSYLHATNLVEAVLSTRENYVVIAPNNDLGCDQIFLAYRKFKNNPRIRYFPSLRFEQFLTLLKNANYIIGNSSCGIHEAPYFGVPTVNIGTRQNGRALNQDIIHTGYGMENILQGIRQASNTKLNPVKLNGDGDSAERFVRVIRDEGFWNSPKQKTFLELPKVA